MCRCWNAAQWYAFPVSSHHVGESQGDSAPLPCSWKTLPKSKGGREALFGLQVIVHQQGKARAWRQERKETAEKHWAHVCSQVHVSYHSYSPRSPKNGTTHSGLGPRVSIISPENATLSCPQPKLIEAVLQLRIPLTRCIQLTKKLIRA